MLVHLLLWLACLTAAAPVHAELQDSRRVVTVETFLSQDRIRPNDVLQLAVRLTLEPGWHLNAHDTDSEFLIPTDVLFAAHPALTVTDVRYPPAVRRYFTFAGASMDVYEGTALIIAEGQAASAIPEPDGMKPLVGSVSLQACNDTVCLAPAEMAFAMALPMAASGTPIVAAHPEIFGASPLGAAPAQPLGSGWLGQLLAHQSVWVWLLAALLAGLALNLTPCVYPMIPVTLAFFSGQAAGRIGAAVWLAVCYLLGMSLTYAVLGTVAAKTGVLLGSWLQQPAVLLGIAALVVALALSMFGLYELRPPRWIADRFGRAQAGAAGAFVMGLTVGLIAVPCIGPFVVGLLLFVSQLASPWLGFAIFLAVGIGMGAPYVLLGVFANQLPRLPKAGAWLVWVNKALGVILLGLAVYFVHPLFPSGRQESAASVAWQAYSPQRFEEARREGRPLLIDIYADWCLPCVELDHVTFRHSQVVERLAGFTTLRVDATQDVPPEAQELLERHGVYGVPTVLVFDAGGRERSDLRITGFVTPQALLERLSKLSAS
ncbi:MAG: thioredoxin family protein [Candidatus Omnitrophica bacterium]|nr:thioredoxin family protein [Candidatus Omnitrophota bacterium]